MKQGRSVRPLSQIISMTVVVTVTLVTRFSTGLRKVQDILAISNDATQTRLARSTRLR